VCLIKIIELCKELISKNIIFNLKKFINCQLSPINKSFHSNSVYKLKTCNIFSKNSPLGNFNLNPSQNKTENQKKTIPISFKKLDFSDINNLEIINNTNLINDELDLKNNSQEGIFNDVEFKNINKAKTINYNYAKNNKKFNDNCNNNIIVNKENSNGDFNINNIIDNTKPTKAENLQNPKSSKIFTKSRNNFIKIQESISITTLDKINRLRKGRIDKTNSINTIDNNNVNTNVNQQNQTFNINNNITIKPINFAGNNKNLNLDDLINQNLNNKEEKSNFQKYMKIVKIF